MAGAQITTVASQIEAQRLGYQAISLSNFTHATAECQIHEGSKVEIGGALYQFTSDEAISGFASITVSTDAYIYLAVSGTSVTAGWSETAPTWSETKQGWYNAGETQRCIGGCYKDASSNYVRKWLYEETAIASIKRYGSGEVATQAGTVFLMKKVIEIGDWDMDTTDSVNVAHGLTLSKIINVRAIIRDDADTDRRPLDTPPRMESDFFSFTGNGTAIFDIKATVYGRISLDSTYVVLERYADQTVADSGTSQGISFLARTSFVGQFDSSSYNATSYNRGWIVIEYTP